MSDEREKISRMRIVTERLKKAYPDSSCVLEYGNEGWRLLVMGRLSAQCTDARVNEVCKSLFEKFRDPESFAAADIEELENAIKPCGLYRVKAADIKASCKILVEKYGGEVPKTAEELLEFPGVGRKIANLLLGDLYGIPGIVADTHCIRICGRLGMYEETLKNAVKVEKILSSVVEKSEQTALCHRLVAFGKSVCRARSPECGSCILSNVCAHNAKI